MLPAKVAAFVTGLIWLLLGSSGSLAASPTKPNILLIVAEDLSPRLGAYGDALARTPAIDALAQSGVRYTHAFTAAGVCAPSRSALITGVYPQSMGTHQMRTRNMGYDAVPPPAIKAFPELLRRAGYVTANSMKKDYQFGEPFTVWDVDAGDYSTPADLALWRQLPQDRPFFAMITLMDTHESRLVGSQTEGAGNWQGFVAGIRAQRAQWLDAAATDPARVVVPPYYPDVDAVRENLAQHYDNIHHIDGQIAQVLGNLQADGLADSTVVLFTTDHGDGLPRAKRSVYDSGLWVPLIVRYPDGRDAGRLESRMVSFVDIAPTLLQIAGVEVPAYVQGRDFLSSPARQYVFAGRDRMDQVPDRVRAARDERYKYIRNFMPELAYFRPLTFRDMFPVMQSLWQGQAAGVLNTVQAAYFQAPRPAEELYDLYQDPYEIHNLAGQTEHEATLMRMRLALDEWLVRVGDLAEDPETVMIERMWPDGRQPVTAPPRATFGAQGVTLSSATPGASIGYRRLGSVPSQGWQLYTQALPLSTTDTLEAKAIRYGFAESPVVKIDPSVPQAPAQ